MRPASRFRYYGDRLICEACDGQNPQSRVRSIPRELLARRSARDEHLSEDHDPCARDRLPRADSACLSESEGGCQYAFPMIVRINDVGRAETIDYRNFQYRSPGSQEQALL